MAAFSSNIDITSGGTYGMDVTNGESSLKVANDLNGKMANIQQYLQNGLPEVWTGDSLPDSLPNGKTILYNNRMYLNSDGIKYLLNQDFYNTLNTLLNNNKKPAFISTSLRSSSTRDVTTINIGFNFTVAILFYYEGDGSHRRGLGAVCTMLPNVEFVSNSANIYVFAGAPLNTINPQIHPCLISHLYSDSNHIYTGVGYKSGGEIYFDKLDIIAFT